MTISSYFFHLESSDSQDLTFCVLISHCLFCQLFLLRSRTQKTFLYIVVTIGSDFLHLPVASLPFFYTWHLTVRDCFLLFVCSSSPCLSPRNHLSLYSLSIVPLGVKLQLVIKVLLSPELHNVWGNHKAMLIKEIPVKRLATEQ